LSRFRRSFDAARQKSGQGAAAKFSHRLSTH
jgi:hypothetical protein